MADTILVLALAAVGVGIVTSIMIVNEVSKRGVKINYPLLRLYLFKYIHLYGRMTRQESGKPALLYHLCTGAYFTALVLAVVHLILR
jgi:hypothetical protein